MTYRTVTVTAVFSSNIISASASLADNTITAEAGLTTNVQHYYSEYPNYEGETTFTPTAETQTISTAEKVLLTDITINPIPSNYGLITWNGSTLTVS